MLHFRLVLRHNSFISAEQTHKPNIVWSLCVFPTHHLSQPALGRRRRSMCFGYAGSVKLTIHLYPLLLETQISVTLCMTAMSVMHSTVGD